jgi:hypothetical protein
MRSPENFTRGCREPPEPRPPLNYEPTQCFDQQGNRIEWSECEDDDSEDELVDEQEEQKEPKDEEQKGPEEEGGEEKDGDEEEVNDGLATVQKKGGFKIEVEDPSLHQEQPNFDGDGDDGSADE